MEKEIKLPSISEGDDSGQVLEIYVKEGEEVEEEQSLLSVEADKANVDVPAEEAGTVKSINVSEGDEVSQGSVLLILETGKEGDKSSDTNKSGEDEYEESAESGKQNEEGDDREFKAERRKKGERGKKQPLSDKSMEGETESESAVGTNEADTAAAPLAKKFARELGLSIEEIADGGPEERVTRQDVFDYAKKAIESGGKEPDHTDEIQHEPLPDFSKWGETEREPLNGIRRKISERTTHSWQTIPHVTQFDRADITDIEDYRSKWQENNEQKLSLTAILIKICAIALEKYPKFNASIDLNEKEVVYKKYVNIGLATATDRGLLLPVLKNVHQKGLQEISDEMIELTKKARDGRLGKEDMEGGNFVISNQGVIGGRQFTPVIFPPQVAILGISASSVEPVYDEEIEDFEPRLILPVSMSYDHRLIDGAEAAEFVDWICRTIENPVKLLF